MQLATSIQPNQKHMNIIRGSARQALQPLRRTVVPPVVAALSQDRDEFQQQEGESPLAPEPHRVRRPQRQPDNVHPVTPDAAPRDMTLTAAQAEDQHAGMDEGEDEPPPGQFGEGEGVPGPMLPDRDSAHPPNPSPSSAMLPGSPAALPSTLPVVPKPLLMTNSQTRRTLARSMDGGFPAAGVYVTTILTSVGIVVASMAGSTAPSAAPGLDESLDSHHHHWHLGFGVGSLPVASMVGSLSPDSAHPLNVPASLRAAVGAAAARAAAEQQHLVQQSLVAPSPDVAASAEDVKRPLVKPPMNELLKKSPDLLPPSTPPIDKTVPKLAPGPGPEGQKGGPGSGDEEVPPDADLGNSRRRPPIDAQPIPCDPQSLLAPQVNCSL